MQIKCANCRCVFDPADVCCTVCGAEAVAPANGTTASSRGRFAKRISVLLAVCIAAVAGFYLSLVTSAAPLSRDERAVVTQAIVKLEAAGFSDEVFLLKYAAAFRSNDNWLNASVEKENAYAATNFPFEIITFYPDFFTYASDTTERAAILLHEAKHLQGKNEADAYRFVWKNRKRIGWTSEAYGRSDVWLNVRRQTSEYIPNMFICDFNPGRDCTE